MLCICSCTTNMKFCSRTCNSYTNISTYMVWISTSIEANFFCRGIIVYMKYSIITRLSCLKIKSIFIVGILTVIGYSVNDTIVIFDRIRENQILNRSREFFDTVNKSVKESITRSLGTSITTSTVILSMLLFGGQSLRDFLIVLLLGVIIGTYSSIFVASNLLILWRYGPKK